MGKQRARTPEEKNQRRQTIIDAVETLFYTKGYEATTVQDIATQAQMAKGSLFDYFGSKEEMFLALAGRLFNGFVQRMTELIDQTESSDQSALCDILVEVLDREAGLRALLAIMNSSIERNCSIGAIREAKRGLLQRLSYIGHRLEDQFPFMPTGQGMGFLYRAYGIALGLEALATPCAAAREAMESDEFAFFRLDYRTELRQTLKMLLKTMTP